MCRGVLVFGSSPTALRMGTCTKKAGIWSGRGMLVVGIVPAASGIGTSHTNWNWKQGSGTGSENNNKKPTIFKHLCLNNPGGRDSGTHL